MHNVLDHLLANWALLGFKGICLKHLPVETLLSLLYSRDRRFAISCFLRRFAVDLASGALIGTGGGWSLVESAGNRFPVYINYVVGLGLPVELVNCPQVILLLWISVGRGGCGDGVGEAEALSSYDDPWRIKGNLAEVGVSWVLCFLTSLRWRRHQVLFTNLWNRVGFTS
ncbi:hypothetical protein C2845_PM01G42630 [Panicum miliaceum]|uniref:Uncharacterized protein n=1 Tax=Panicum miliaceum TaxID=4540 RepID=A0A3L6TGS0_PANMI|nr:hypothetical protein C2845_PM01G42630 [Panicum miliaceum]